MKFSVKVQYGLQALLELALAYGGGPVPIASIAKTQKIPIRYLEQLMLVLKRKGLVTSLRGKQGGYTLAKHPSDISIMEVVETFEGPIELISKKMRKSPVLLEVFEKIQDNLKKELRETTLEDLVLKKRQKDRAYTYYI